MALDLITHGTGEGMYLCLQAMASLFNGNGSQSMVGTLLIIGGMFSAVFAVLKLTKDFNLLIPVNWIYTYVILISLLTVPKVEIRIVDRVTGLRDTVERIPLLFGLPAAYISQIGDLIAREIDNRFSLPTPMTRNPSSLNEVMKYTNSGVAMTAKLINNATKFTFVNHQIANNMREFVKECVYYDLAFGKYSVEDLRNSDDIWGLVSTNPSPHGGVFYTSKQQGVVSTEWLSCRGAVGKLNHDWEIEKQAVSRFYGKKLYPHRRPDDPMPAERLKANLVHAYDYLAGISREADQLTQQMIMRNALEDGVIARAIQDNVQGAIHNYSVAKAEALQEAAYDIQGGVAEKSVAFLKIIVELILYSMFPLVAVLSVLPLCSDLLKTYFTALLWLQSWAPLYSIINMIANVYGQGEASNALISPIHEGATLNFDTIPALGAASASITKYAGYAMASVPFLSWGLFKYGGGALAQMSAHFGHPAQAASGSIANEVVTGNISQGQRAFDVETRSSVNGFKFDQGLGVSSNMSSIQTSSGGIYRATTNGAAMLDRTPEISRLGIGINNREEVASSFNQMSSDSLSAAQSSMEAGGKALSSAYDTIQDYRQSNANQVSNDISISKDEGFSLSQAFSEAQDIAESYSKRYGSDLKDSISEMSRTSFGAGVELSGGLKFMGTGVTARGTIGKEKATEHRDDHSESASLAQEEQLQMAHRFNSVMDKINRHTQSEAFRNSSSENKAFSDSLSARMNEAYNSRSEASSSLSESKQWQEAANYIITTATGVNEDLSQDFVNWASYQLGKDGYELGISGIQEAMQNPEERTQLLHDYLQSHKQVVLKQFSNQSLANKERIHQYHDSNQNIMRGNELAKEHFDLSTQSVQEAQSPERLKHQEYQVMKDNHMKEASQRHQEISDKQLRHEKIINKIKADQETFSNKHSNISNKMGLRIGLDNPKENEYSGGKAVKIDKSKD